MIYFPGMILTEQRAKSYLEQKVWTEESFIDVLQADVRKYPHYLHKDEKRSLTYEELWQEVNSTAASLYQLGVRKGDKVAIQLPNCLDYVVAVFAAGRIGAVAVLLQVDLGLQALQYSLSKAEVSVWIGPDSFRGEPVFETAKTIQPDLPHLKHLVLQGNQTAAPSDVLTFEQLRSTNAYLSPAELSANQPSALDPFIMVFTSGTTGSPKGVVQLHANYLWASRAYASVFRFRSGEATLDVAPICHQTGMLAGVMMPIATGGRVLLLDRFSAPRLLKWVSDERPSYIVGAPPHVIHVANAPGLTDTDTSSVKLFIYAGAPVPSAILQRLQENTGITVGAMFGWTEGFLATSTRPDDPIEAISSTVGFAIPGTEVKLVDEHGNEVAQGMPGEMWSRGPNFSAGYYHNPEAAARQWDTDGWFHSGDLLRQDENGRYVFMGRADDIINRGGTKVDPKAVEDACALHPSIENVAVVGAPDETLGQQTVACIVLKEGFKPFQAAELRNFLSQHGLAKFQFPDRLIFLDALPLTHSGKIKKKDLRRQLQDDELFGGEHRG
ncbi:class I adenylate-forming enzyme family protein [Alicyclobacillus ferrooxydans]|uniref:AMP-dependent synthetase n=1 Tax=Alicyclobacillus ferrooxydans TaxID=471514 RepID=A0A0P9C6S5_9BACL|nr:class I adenylate-forming enzyme family protein [Alicyclobacillus ferrooxydans]KPV40531.1 AMP-dependent synthetase [Alicyclobacillus ferrooxydans]